MKIDVFIILACSILMTACHKKSNTDTEPRYYIDTRIIGNEFKPGSYWIYSNDSTRKTDCSYVFKVENGFQEKPYDLSGNKAFYEYYDVFCHDKDSLNSNEYDQIRLEESYIYRLAYYDDNPLNDALLYYFPGKEEWIFFSFDTIEHIDTLQIGNNKYGKIQKATIDTNHNSFFTSASFGVVRKVIHRSSHQGTWNLLRWNIIN